MLLNVENVSKSYKNLDVLKGISLELELGKSYGLLGPNGCGKTTLMKAVDGLVTPDSGKIYYKSAEIDTASKGKIVYMPTEGYFYKYMKVKDAVKYFQDFYEDFDLEYAKKASLEMDIDWEKKISSMSSGQVAKLKLMLALSRDADLYMLDEPLNGIDLVARDEVCKMIIERLGNQKTMLISSHLVEELEILIDSVIMMKDGQVAVEGDCDLLRSERGKSIADIYREIYSRGGSNA